VASLGLRGELGGGFCLLPPVRLWGLLFVLLLLFWQRFFLGVRVVLLFFFLGVTFLLLFLFSETLGVCPHGVSSWCFFW